MKLFVTPNSKNIIATLRTVTIEEFQLTFLITLYFHGSKKYPGAITNKMHIITFFQFGFS